MTWQERFSTFVNRAAKLGPYHKVLAALFHEQTEDAVSSITWQSTCRTYNRQRACRHLKGGKYSPKSVARDYAVTTHTFIDSLTRIKCMLCGTEAWSNSGMDYKFNWLASLAEMSTNCPSASEQVKLEVKRNEWVVDTFPNTAAGRAALKAKYPRWNGLIDGVDQFPEESLWVIPENDERFVQFPKDHSPIKGFLASTLESAEGVIVTAQDNIEFTKEHE